MLNAAFLIMQVFQTESTFLIHHANAFEDGEEIEVTNVNLIKHEINFKMHTPLSDLEHFAVPCLHRQLSEEIVEASYTARKVTDSYSLRQINVIEILLLPGAGVVKRVGP